MTQPETEPSSPGPITFLNKILYSIFSNQIWFYSSLQSFNPIEFGNKKYLIIFIFSVYCSAKNDKILVSLFLKKINFL